MTDRLENVHERNEHAGADNTYVKKDWLLDDSPFDKKLNMTAPRGAENLQAQVSDELFEMFMKFATAYNDENDIKPKGKSKINRSEPLKYIVNKFFNSVALERECFEQLFVIMAFDKIDFKAKDDINAAVIGFVNSTEQFTKRNIFQDYLNKGSLIYMVYPFNKRNFDMLNLKQFDTEVLFDVNPSVYGSFDDVKSQLQKKHDIDFDNAEFCMFNINNYLDTLKNGVYVSKHSEHSHEGFVVLRHYFSKFDKLFVRFDWGFNAGKLSFDFTARHDDFFNVKELPEDVRNELEIIHIGMFSSSAKPKIELKFAEQELELVEAEQRELEKQREHLKQVIADRKKAIEDNSQQ